MTQSEAGTVVARFQVTPEEVYDAMLALGQEIYGFSRLFSRFGKYGNWLFAALASLVTIAILLVGSFIALATGVMSGETAFLVILSMFWGAAFCISWLSQFQKRRIRAALARQNLNTEVTLFDNGQFLSWDTPDQKYSWKYDQFDTLMAYKGGYYLVSGLAGLFVPGRAFADESSKKRFENTLKEKMRPDVIAAFFQAERR
jgi:hypothetical protein